MAILFPKSSPIFSHFISENLGIFADDTPIELLSKETSPMSFSKVLKPYHHFRHIGIL